MNLEYNATDKTLSGPLLICDVPYESGRIYPKDEVVKALLKYQPQIDKGLSFGILGLTPNQSVVELASGLRPETLAVKLSNTYFDDNVLMGVFDILYKTNDGGLLVSMLNARMEFKAAAAATGVIDENKVVRNMIIHYFYVTKP